MPEDLKKIKLLFKEDKILFIDRGQQNEAVNDLYRIADTVLAPCNSGHPLIFYRTKDQYYNAHLECPICHKKD